MMNISKIRYTVLMDKNESRRIYRNRAVTSGMCFAGFNMG